MEEQMTEESLSDKIGLDLIQVKYVKEAVKKLKERSFGLDLEQLRKLNKSSEIN